MLKPSHSHFQGAKTAGLGRDRTHGEWTIPGLVPHPMEGHKKAQGGPYQGQKQEQGWEATPVCSDSIQCASLCPSPSLTNPTHPPANTSFPLPLPLALFARLTPGYKP